MMNQLFKRSSKFRNNNPVQQPLPVAYTICPGSNHEHQLRHNSSIPCKVEWYIYIDKVQPQKENLIEQSSSSLGESLSNKDILRAPIQIKRERHSKNLK